MVTKVVLIKTIPIINHKCLHQCDITIKMTRECYHCCLYKVYMKILVLLDATAGGLLVLEGIIRSVVTALALTWFIRYIYYHDQYKGMLLFFYLII